MSEGRTSGVNCTRPYSRPSAFETEMAIVVLPTPGMSSIRMCPPAMMASRTFMSDSSFPTMTLLTSRIMERAWPIEFNSFIVLLQRKVTNLPKYFTILIKKGQVLFRGLSFG